MAFMSKPVPTKANPHAKHLWPYFTYFWPYTNTQKQSKTKSNPTPRLCAIALFHYITPECGRLQFSNIAETCTHDIILVVRRIDLCSIDKICHVKTFSVTDRWYPIKSEFARCVALNKQETREITNSCEVLDALVLSVWVRYTKMFEKWLKAHTLERQSSGDKSLKYILKEFSIFEMAGACNRLYLSLSASLSILNANKSTRVLVCSLRCRHKCIFDSRIGNFRVLRSHDVLILADTENDFFALYSRSYKITYGVRNWKNITRNVLVPAARSTYGCYDNVPFVFVLIIATSISRGALKKLFITAIVDCNVTTCSSLSPRIREWNQRKAPNRAWVCKLNNFCKVKSIEINTVAVRLTKQRFVLIFASLKLKSFRTRPTEKEHKNAHWAR